MTRDGRNSEGVEPWLGALSIRLSWYKLMRFLLLRSGMARIIIWLPTVNQLAFTAYMKNSLFDCSFR